MNVRSICLAILFCGENTGYDIRKASTEGMYNYFVDASFGSIYPALNRLEKEGLVTCRREAIDGKPARKIYRITEAGRAEFLKELCGPTKPDVYRSEFLLVAMYARLLGPDIMRKAIAEQMQHLQAELSIIDACSNGENQEDGVQHDEEQMQLIQEAAQWNARYGRHCVQSSIDYLTQHGDELVEIAKRFPPAWATTPSDTATDAPDRPGDTA